MLGVVVICCWFGGCLLVRMALGLLNSVLCYSRFLWAWVAVPLIVLELPHTLGVYVLLGIWYLVAWIRLMVFYLWLVVLL